MNTGPWEKFQNADAERGPWDKFQQQPAKTYQPTRLQSLADTITSAMNTFAPAIDLAQKGANAVSLLTNPMQGFNAINAQRALAGAQELATRAGEATAELGGRVGFPKTGVAAGFAVENAPNLLLAKIPMGEAKLPLPGAQAMEGVAQSAGRRALGFSKRLLNKSGAVEAANDVTKTMLDEGVIRKNPFANTAERMIDRAEALSGRAGQGISQAIEDLTRSGYKSFSTAELSKKIESELMPKYQGGLFDHQRAVVREITATVNGVARGRAPFDAAQDLKQTLQAAGNFNSGSDAMRTVLYRKASGIVRQALDDSIEQAAKANRVNPTLLKKYLADKQIYGRTQTALDALQNRLSSEAGNKQLGLTDYIVGAGELAAGKPGLGALAIGAKRGLERFGNSSNAVAARSYAQSGIGPKATKAALMALRRQRADNE